MRKRSISILLVFIAIALVLPLTTTAAATYKLTLHLEVEDPTDASKRVPLEGGVYSLYKVASATKNSSGGYTYTPTSDFEDSGETLDGLSFWAGDGSYNSNLETKASTLAEYAKDRKVNVTATETTNEEGDAYFTIDSENAGLYLAVCAPVKKTFGSDTRTYTPQATLVALPFPAKDGSSWLNSVKIKAKITTESPDEPKLIDITVKKVWKGGGNHPSSVTVQLFRDGELFDEQVLNSGNGWSHTWTTTVSGHTWRVDEVEVPDGYTFDIAWEGNVATVTNTRDDGPSPDDPTPSPNDPDDPTPSPNDPDNPTPSPNDPNDPTPSPNVSPGPSVPPNNPGNPGLPQTGQLWWPVPLLAAVGVLLLLIGAVLFVRKEEPEEPHE